MKSGTEAHGPRSPLRARIPSSYWILASGLLDSLPLAPAAPPRPRSSAADHAVSDYYMGDYRDAQRRLAPLAQKTDENYVLNNVRLGSAALVDYNLDQAEAAFLRAYEVINSTGVNDPSRAFGAAVLNEKIKVWKGEPYERAMANFYLGLIYYMRHDYGNARAAFENSLFKLRDYGEGKEKTDEYRSVESNFALGYLMLAKCWQHLGDDDAAQKNFDRAVELRPYLRYAADPERNRRANMLLVVDFGMGPQKVTNYDGAIVGFAPTPAQVGPVPPPMVVVDGRPVSLGGADRPPVDLLALAQDRRWQDIDTIRTIKTSVGTGLIAGGTYAGLQSHHQSDQLVGLALIGAGLLLKGSSVADTRQWEMLPRTTFVLPLEVAPGTHDVTIEFPNAPGLRQTWRRPGCPPPGEEATYYFRIQRFRGGPYTWPPPGMNGDGSPGSPVPASTPQPQGPATHAPLAADPGAP